MDKFTPGPWKVRTRTCDGELAGCFVEAPDVNGFAYAAEVLGDDEYRDHSGGMDRRLADCKLVAAAPDLLDAVRALLKSPGLNHFVGLDEVAKAQAAIAKATA